jgi:hypothetical protein
MSLTAAIRAGGDGCIVQDARSDALDDPWYNDRNKRTLRHL